MLMVLIRALVMYVVVMVAMRLMGKRMIGQLQPFELAVAMLMADLAAAPLSEVGTPLLYGVLPILALLLMHSVMSLLCYRFPAVRALVSGRPTLLIKDGVIDRDQLTRQCFSISDLMEALRVAGQLDIAQVGTAILETNGQLSAFADADHRPPTTQELHIRPRPEGAPLVLLIDGRPDGENLRLLGRDEGWLRAQLRAADCAPEDTLLCTLDRQGMLHAQDYAGRIHRRRALTEAEARV